MAKRIRGDGEIRRFDHDRGRFGAGFFGGLLAALLALRALAGLAGDAGFGAYALLDFGLGVGVVAMAVCAWRLGDRRPALTVGPEGLFAPRAMAAPAPWDAIEAVRLKVSHLRTLRLATLEIAIRGRETPVRVELLKLADPEQAVLSAIDRYRLVERPRALGAPPPDVDAEAEKAG